MPFTVSIVSVECDAVVRPETKGCGFSLGHTLPFDYRQLTVHPGNCHGLGCPIRPFDLNLVDACRYPESKVQGHIILRTKAAPADYVLPLTNLTSSDIG